MLKIRITLALFMSSVLLSGCHKNEKIINNFDWLRKTKTTLIFKGQITSESFNEFIKSYDDEINTIIIDSEGGDADSAISIGSYIRKRPIKIIVDGKCLSSCANYIFLSANMRYVSEGSYVGFHGNISSGKYKLEREFINIYDNLRISEAEKIERKRQSIEYIKNLIKKESIINNLNEVNQVFFDCGQMFVSMNNAQMWIVSPTDLKRFGIEVQNMWYSENPGDYRNMPQDFKLTSQNKSSEWHKKCQ